METMYNQQLFLKHIKEYPIILTYDRTYSRIISQDIRARIVSTIYKLTHCRLLIGGIEPLHQNKISVIGLTTYLTGQFNLTPVLYQYSISNDGRISDTCNYQINSCIAISSLDRYLIFNDEIEYAINNILSINLDINCELELL